MAGGERARADLANAQAKRADTEKREALFQAYRAWLAAAAAALSAHDVADAAATSTRRRRICAIGNGGTCTAGSMTALR